MVSNTVRWLWPLRLSTLQRRNCRRDGNSNHRLLECLLNRLFRRRSQKKIPRHWPLWGESTGEKVNSPHKGPVTGNVSIWWRHHERQTPRPLASVFFYLGPCSSHDTWDHGQILQMSVIRSVDLFEVDLGKLLNKQSRFHWFETSL